MEITYASIKPLIKKEELVNGNQINLEFCAKNQDTPLQTVAIIMADQSEMNKNIAKNVGKSVAKNTILSVIAGFFGSLIGGVGGSAVSSATSMAGSQVMNKNSNGAADMMKTEITPEKKEKAIVDAFSKLASMYQYNEGMSEWEFKK